VPRTISKALAAPVKIHDIEAFTVVIQSRPKDWQRRVDDLGTDTVAWYRSHSH